MRSSYGAALPTHTAGVSSPFLHTALGGPARRLARFSYFGALQTFQFDGQKVGCWCSFCRQRGCPGLTPSEQPLPPQPPSSVRHRRAGRAPAVAALQPHSNPNSFKSLQLRRPNPSWRHAVHSESLQLRGAGRKLTNWAQGAPGCTRAQAHPNCVSLCSRPPGSKRASSTLREGPSSNSVFSDCDLGNTTPHAVG